MAPQPPQQFNYARAAAREEVYNIFLSIGYNINDGEDLRKLREDLEWAQDKRISAEQSVLNRWRLIGTIIVAVVGSLVTVVIQTIVSYFPGRMK